jgi:hypothetical protein
MNDMTPMTNLVALLRAGRLNAINARTMLEKAGAKNVSVVGRGMQFLAFFETGRKRHAWVIRGDAWVANFSNDVMRELIAH